MKILSLTIATIFFAIVPAVTQTCDHTTDSFKRFDEMKVSLPITVTYFDGRKVEGVATSVKDKTDKAVEFYIEGSSSIAPEFRTDYKKGKWWVIYSSCDQYAYFVLPLLKGQYVKAK